MFRGFTEALALTRALCWKTEATADFLAEGVTHPEMTNPNSRRSVKGREGNQVYFINPLGLLLGGLRLLRCTGSAGSAILLAVFAGRATPVSFAGIGSSAGGSGAGKWSAEKSERDEG
jgi:hypothetical protein